VRAGSLRHLVVIEKPIAGKDANGFPITTWAAFPSPGSTFYVSIEQIKAYDKAAVAATWPGADTTITMRYVAGVTGNMRINHNGVIYSILGQPNNVDGRNRELILTCETGVKAQ